MIIIVLVISVICKRTEGNTLSGIKVHMDSVTRANDIIVVNVNTPIKITLYGTNIDKCTQAFFTKVELPKGSSCYSNQSTPTTLITKGDKNAISLEVILHQEGVMYFCLLCNGIWLHQGTDKVKSIMVYRSYFLLPTWLLIVIVVILYFCSALFSGLNLSLMIFSPSTLELLIMAGNKAEKNFAQRIYPVRKLGNVLLCSILLGNVVVNSTITIIIDKISKNAIFTISFTTVTIVIFGEIFPQAFGTRHPLLFSAHTIWLATFILIVTFIIAYPVGKILNCILGKEIRQYYSKEKLKLLIKEQEKFGFVMKDEVEIISGALALTEKTVTDVMTPISHAFMINYHSNLDYNTMKEIVRNGYTRIPVYDNDKNNIKGILNIKDLTFIDPDDNIPVSTVCTFYNRQILIVPYTTKLPEMLDEFKKGKAHLAFIEKVMTTKDRDPYQLYIGLITLEDVIEEIFQDEILDETDIFSNNFDRKRTFDQDSRSAHFISPMKQFILSPQLYEATIEYMIKNISSFNEQYVKKRVLESLLSSKILLNHVHKTDSPESNRIIEIGRPIVCAILIIQGKVSVKTSSENLYFEGGPFMMFGELVLKNINEYMKKGDANQKMNFDNQMILNQFKSIPDYTVESTMNLQYICITAAQYILARQMSYFKPTIDFNILRSEKYYEEWNGLGATI